ncbi:unnamed protein product [Diamesa serratosioi]
MSLNKMEPETKSSAILKHEKTDTKLHNSVLISLISGSLAGGLAKTFISPLDRCKINFQINKQIIYTARNAVNFIINIYKKEGFLALYRGNSATLARILPYAGIQFASHEQYKKLLHSQTGGNDFKRFLAGSLAGITSQSLTYPLDLARARMAITDKSGYKNIFEVFRIIFTKEGGTKALFRGYVATVLGVIPYAGCSFYTYETLKLKYCEYTGDIKPNAIYSLMFGAVAGICGQTSSYPLDIVRRRMQTSGMAINNNDVYTSVRQTLVKIYNEEGIVRGFYKGLSMNWVKGPIAVGISFSTYDRIKQFLQQLSHEQNELH